MIPANILFQQCIEIILFISCMFLALCQSRYPETVNVTNRAGCSKLTTSLVNVLLNFKR